MADVLYFNGTALGDYIIRPLSSTRPATQPNAQSALFQENADVVSTSRNLVHSKTFFVKMKKADQWAFDQAAEAIQRLVGMTGTVEVKIDGQVKLRWAGVTFFSAPEPETSGNFGARWVAEWPLTFISSSKPEWQ